MPNPRFTRENTTGATTQTLDAMNKEFEGWVGGIHSDTIKDEAAEMIIKDHGGKWNGSSWKPSFGGE